MKDKPTDNIKELANQQRRTNRLNSIKNGIENGTIKEWDQMFAIMTETRIATELGISFYSFRRKCHSPGRFCINEVMRFAALLGVKYDTMHAFIVQMIKAKSKSKIFRD